MSKIVGLIPAAGKGTRLGLPFPKELYPIVTKAGRIALVAGYALEQLLNVTNKIVAVVSPEKHQLMAYLGNGSRFDGCSICYMVQEEGTDLADVVRAAYPAIKGKTVAFVMPDTIIEPDNAIDRMVAEMQPEDDMVMGLFRVNDPSKFGMVTTWNNIVTGVVDKPDSLEALQAEYAWGCLVWRPEFTGDVVFDGQTFGDTLNNLAHTGQIRAVFFDDGHYYDLGTVEGIKEYLYDSVPQMQ